MEIKKEVFKKLQEKTKIKFDENSNVYEIGIDSLDLIESITDIEEKYDVRISDNDLQSIKNVGDIIIILEKTIKLK